MSCEFFAGANTCSGYCSGLDELADEKVYQQVYLLQGSPGNGKSTLLKKIAQEAQRTGRLTEVIRCSFDPDSLDGVVVGDISVLDATSPHEVSPKYIAAVETPVDLSHACSHKLLAAYRHRIISLIAEKKELYRQSARYIYGAAALYSDISRTLSQHLNEEKLTRLARRIARDYFTEGAGSPRDQTRYLSAHTAIGEVYLWNTVPALAKTVFLIEDEYDLIAHPMLTLLRTLAHGQGLSTISCRNPLYAHESLQHLFIPELSIGFLCLPKRSDYPYEPTRVINWRRFADKEKIAQHKHSIRLQRKAANQMLAQSSLLLLEMRLLHCELEELYRPCIDYHAVDALSKRLMDEIL